MGGVKVKDGGIGDLTGVQIALKMVMVPVLPIQLHVTVWILLLIIWVMIQTMIMEILKVMTGILYLILMELKEIIIGMQVNYFMILGIRWFKGR